MKVYLQASLWIILLLHSVRASDPVIVNEKAHPAITRWEPVWKNWNAVAAIEVDYFFFQALQGVGGPFATPSELQGMEDMVRQFVESTDSPELNDLDSLTQIAFPKEKSTGKSNGRWVPTHLIQDRDKLRLDMTERLPPRIGEEFDPERYDTTHHTIARVSGKEVDFIAFNRQISVFDSYSGKKIPTTRDFLLTPNRLETMTDWVSSHKNPDRIHLSGVRPDSGTIEIDVDASTGFIHRMKQSAGPFAEVRNQYLPIMQESGIPVARVVTTIFYKDELPRSIDLIVVRAFQIETSIPDSRFDVEVPPGVLAVRFPEYGTHVPESRGGVRPPMERVLSSQPSAVALTRERGFGDGAHPHPRMPPAKPHKLLFFVNLIGLSLLLAFMGIRRVVRSRSGSRSSSSPQVKDSPP